jgi:inorganic triphosphatase YgiF
VAGAGGGAARPLAEVELELKRGQPAALFGVARTLAEAARLRLSFKAKSERGYDLLSGERPKPTKAEPLRLSPGMTSGEAFQAIGRSCLRQYVANEAVLRRERNPDAVHQMRVALRRLRAAVTLFKDAVADGERDAVRGELKRMADELGPARDLDVFIAKTLKPARERHGDDPEFGALLADYEGRREAAYGRALRGVASGDFARSVLRTAAWIEAGDWLSSEDVRAARERPVEAHAAAELDRRWRKVRRRARGLRRLSPEARHAIRIEIKKLRYAAEFFASLFGEAGRAKRRKAALSTLETLQEVLGDLNDIAVGAAETATGALAALQAEQAARVEPLLAEVKEAARALRDAEPFWRD